ncbi:hypothetical protein RND81_13G151400 [Saponaria officinalis]|uniref:Uncharacterized protein n=1 Tax=Saponaria officinalis TaxID=3572 RepID=A0AAW1H0Y3_SAPOF
MKLVSHIFEGSGYGNWKRSMFIALSAKNKLGFIDGTQVQPPTDSATSKQWQRCNDMVFSWLINALSSEIADSVLYCQSAHDVWVELEDRFGKSNGAQLYAVHKKLNDFNQGNDRITTYFTKLKSIWDEIASMGMNPSCSCTCTCGSKQKQTKYIEDQKIVQFLMGLNDSYTAIRGTILMQNPLPKISTVYNNLVQEERQRDIHNVTQFQMDSASFYAQNNRTRPAYSGKPFSTNPLKCKFCKKQGHTIDKCYKLQNRGKRFDGHVQTDNSGSILGIYDADHHNQHVQNVQNPSQTDQFTHLSANFAGNSFSSISSDFLQNSWIIDSGATDHMCANKSLFSSLMQIPKPYTISLPNGQYVTINSVGTVVVSPEITLVNHNRLGHLPLYKLKLLDVCNAFPNNENELNSCSICAKSRQYRLSFPKSSTTSSTAFELVHIDVWGPYPTPTYNGYKYFLTIVDDFTRVSWTHLMSQKSNAFPLIKQFIALSKLSFQNTLRLFAQTMLLNLVLTTLPLNFC